MKSVRMYVSFVIHFSSYFNFQWPCCVWQSSDIFIINKSSSQAARKSASAGREFNLCLLWKRLSIYSEFLCFYISPLSAVLFIAIAKINFKSPSRDARCHFPSAIYFQRLLFSFCLIFVFIYLHFQCFCLQYLLKLYSQPFSHECDAMVKNTSWGLHRLSDQDIRLTDSVTNQQMMFTPPRHLIPPLVFQLPMFALSWCCILYGIRHYSASSLVHMPVRKSLTSTKSMGLRQTTLTVRENV